ncbi:zinc finger protein GAI-ASSOCIATED FACTOR 1-like [Argentina anserina]|uniref:zinc finger protein GAI-ASSOCIATED FACTOR 1-like n=1 Tax=Argentina anserina TaxID=57926 RepID=UPI0021763067|nr:zinc finger protein GAI-ASSOCIATED FACTOR 1-like [Potentilla anserina]
MGDLDNSSSLVDSTASGDATFSEPPAKKKRNLPGMPDPEAEVIALSPTTLMATNRFVCEICNKGFQRDQNLQLHRRGHNLPWKLKQRTTTEVRKRVYVCPETSCVHHNPTRALGDLTGIKKHFCRKHGEKKWKCERCSKKYAVQSDWKAHMKTCGTREYKCDCGTLFARRDSFITHRAFCDALAEESAKNQTLGGSQQLGNPNPNPDAGKAVLVASPPLPPLTPSNNVVSPALSIQSSEFPAENPVRLSPPPAATTCLTSIATAISTTATTTTTSTGNCSNTCTSVFASIFAPSSTTSQTPAAANSAYSSAIPSVMEPTSLSLSTSLYLSNNGSSLFPATDHQGQHQYVASPQAPAMSATALLQKAAQMGPAATSGSFLHGFGLATSSSPPQAQDNTASLQWSNNRGGSAAATVAAGLGAANSALLTDLMMGPPLPFGSHHQPMTRDLLGLGIGANGDGSSASSAGIDALLNSFGGGGGYAAYARGEESSWDGAQDMKPNASNGPTLL